MKRFIFSAAVLASMVGGPMLVGCDRTVSDEKKVEQKSNGESTVKEEKVTQNPNTGTMTTTTEKKTNNNP